MAKGYLAADTAMYYVASMFLIPRFGAGHAKPGSQLLGRIQPRVNKMSIEEKLTENKTKNEIVTILCIKCNRLTKHRITASLDKSGSEENRQEDWSIEWIDNYQIIECQGCENVTFRHLNWFSEAVVPECDEDGFTERLYPKRDANTLTTRQFLNVPTTLRRIYSEVIDCFNNECLTLCAAGLRGIVEGVCANQSILNGPVTCPAKGGGTQVVRKDNLEGKIFGLHEKGILTQISAETLHNHRYIGNDAMHDLMKPSTDELKLAIEIVEHILEQLYEIPEKDLELKEKMARRKK